MRRGIIQRMNNPNGANQYVPDPRQSNFLANYLDINSETYSNALQSALRAGYSQEYAENITSTMPVWLSESMGKNKRLQKAEKILDRILELDALDEAGNLDNQALKTQADIAKFIASTVGKKDYSTRSEVTGKDGKDLPTPIINVFRHDSISEDKQS